MGFRQRRFLKTALVAVVLVVAIVGLADAQAALPIVQEIVIAGNDYVDSSLIKAAISKTAVGAEAVEAELIDDMHSIYDLGYFYDVEVGFEQVLGGARLVFTVYENPLVESISITGAEVADPSGYLQEMKTQQGQVLNLNVILQDVAQLADWVIVEQGIFLRPVDLDVSESGAVHITVKETRLEEVVLDGNEKTQDHVILRELTIGAGDVLDLKEINRSLQRVLMLGFFDEISRSFEEVQGDEDRAVMTIHLIERKTGSASAGAGYSSTEGLIGQLQLGDENFLGRGQSVNLTLEFSRSRQTYEFGFQEPYFGSGGMSLGTNIYKRDAAVTKQINDSTVLEGSRHTLGGDITAGWRLTDFTRADLTLTVENITYSTDTAHSQWYEDYSNRTLRLDTVTNTSNHPFYPTEGYRTRFSLEVAASLLGGQSQFSKLNLSHSQYVELFDGGYVLAVRGMYGARVTGSLPESDLFRIGGSETVRGYQFADDGFVGDVSTVANVEFRFPIADSITGVLFSDWGSAWDSSESFQLSDVRHGFGAGVRVDTPLGLLRLDYGWGWTDEQELDGQFYFGFGQTF